MPIDVVSLTQALVREGALSGDEGRVAGIVREAMNALGYDTVETDDLGNVVGLVGPEGAPVRLLLDGHMDVVPATGDWSRDPFSGDIVDGHVHGRGTTDMKGPLAAAICGVAQVADSLKARVAVSASVMEEVIEGAALAAILDRHSPENVVICEPSDMRLIIGQRGCVEILVQVAGVPSHAAFPERGVNAIGLAGRAVTALAAMDLPEDPALGRMVLVPTDIISTPYPSISALPSAVTLRYDRRTGVGETADRIVQDIEAVLHEIDARAFRVTISGQCHTTYTGRSLHAARDLTAWHMGADHPLARAMQASLAEAGLRPDPGHYAFCTNGSEAARRGLPVIGFGPGRPADAHVIDETIRISALHCAQSVYAGLVARLA